MTKLVCYTIIDEKLNNVYGEFTQGTEGAVGRLPE